MVGILDYARDSFSSVSIISPLSESVEGIDLFRDPMGESQTPYLRSGGQTLYVDGGYLTHRYQGGETRLPVSQIHSINYYDDGGSSATAWTVAVATPVGLTMLPGFFYPAFFLFPLFIILILGPIVLVKWLTRSKVLIVQGYSGHVIRFRMNKEATRQWPTFYQALRVAGG